MEVMKEKEEGRQRIHGKVLLSRTIYTTGVHLMKSAHTTGRQMPGGLNAVRSSYISIP